MSVRIFNDYMAKARAEGYNAAQTFHADAAHADGYAQSQAEIAERMGRRPRAFSVQSYEVAQLPSNACKHSALAALFDELKATCYNEGLESSMTAPS